MCPIPAIPVPLAPIHQPPAPGPRPSSGPDLTPLDLRAQTNPLGPAIDLLWDLPDPGGDPDGLELRILRRERRFPGRTRRGVVTVAATATDLADGERVYETSRVRWDIDETREETTPEGRVRTTRQFLYRGEPRDRILVRTIRRELPPEGGTPLRTTVRAIDRRGLEPGTIYYYTAFTGPDGWYSRHTQSSALATGSGRHGLFPLLPRADQERDAAAPDPFAVPRSEHGRGQLERLVRLVGAHADMLLGFVDGLLDAHDSRRADADLLPAMAAMLGWRLRDFLDEDSQRNEISFAPELYRTVGSTDALAAMVGRLTGWSTQARDMVRNVLLTWDVSRVEQLQTGPAYLDGDVRTTGEPPVLVVASVPAGSLDTADAAAMQRLRDRAPDDNTAFSYDIGRPDRSGGFLADQSTWYNRETVGVYARADAATAPPVDASTWRWVSEILAEFLPIQVRAVLVAPPGP